jgi:hypothetical protein
VAVVVRLVPVEPTEEMLAATRQAMPTVYCMLKAAIEAAPAVDEERLAEVILRAELIAVCNEMLAPSEDPDDARRRLIVRSLLAELHG